MSGSDYLKIWYRVQIGATLLILAMMMIRNYEFGRHRIAALLLVAVIILAIALVVELWEQLPAVVKRINAWLQALTQPLILQSRAADIDAQKLHGSRWNLGGVQNAG